MTVTTTANAAPTHHPTTPTAFTYWTARQKPYLLRLERLCRSITGGELLPSDAQVVDFCNDLYRGDPVAERFVDDAFSGENGPAEGRALLERGLKEGIDAIDDAPESMRILFGEFETVPSWVQPELVERGAAIWRKWGTMLFSVAGGITLEMYTEAAVATPLSLAGGYAGDNALRRFLETTRFWMDLSEAGALTRPGSAGRETAMKVRVMHVAVRRRVAEHPEWDSAKWGLPISQGYQILTLLGGSVAPALALWTLGHQTSAADMRALLHYQKFMGHLLGIESKWFPNTVSDALRMLVMVAISRSYDAGEHGAELIESFPASFAPRPGQKGLERLRARYNYGIYGAYCAVFMLPRTRAAYKMPRAFPWVLILLARFPLVTASELVRRFVPPVDMIMEKVAVRHRESWYRAQMSGREAEFNAHGALRR